MLEAAPGLNTHALETRDILGFKALPSSVHGIYGAWSGASHYHKGRVVLDAAADSWYCRNVYARVDVYLPESDGGHDMGDYPWSATVVAAGVAFGKNAKTAESDDTWTMTASRGEGVPKNKVAWSIKKGKSDGSAELAMSAGSYMTMSVYPAGAGKDIVACGSKVGGHVRVELISVTCCVKGHNVNPLTLKCDNCFKSSFSRAQLVPAFATSRTGKFLT